MFHMRPRNSLSWASALAVSVIDVGVWVGIAPEAQLGSKRGEGDREEVPDGRHASLLGSVVSRIRSAG
jgi:hypothetical protein